jgi:hypothetical protein
LLEITGDWAKLGSDLAVLRELFNYFADNQERVSTHHLRSMLLGIGIVGVDGELDDGPDTAAAGSTAVAVADAAAAAAAANPPAPAPPAGAVGISRTLSTSLTLDTDLPHSHPSLRSNRLEAFFMKADTDRDGYITFDEFVALITNAQVSMFDAVAIDVMQALAQAERMKKAQLPVSIVITRDAFAAMCPPPTQRGARRASVVNAGPAAAAAAAADAPAGGSESKDESKSSSSSAPPAAGAVAAAAAPGDAQSAPAADGSAASAPLAGDAAHADEDRDGARRRNALRYHFFKLASMVRVSLDAHGPKPHTFLRVLHFLNVQCPSPSPYLSLPIQCKSVVFAGAEPTMKERLVREVSERCVVTQQHPHYWYVGPPTAGDQPHLRPITAPSASEFINDTDEAPAPDDVDINVIATPVTLAIGDGANDELMIKAANVGVGISGLEGAAAVKASDYALAQFSHLHALLFVHGVWCYNRISFMTYFIFYKASLVAFTMYFFGFFSGFSGQQLFNEATYQVRSLPSHPAISNGLTGTFPSRLFNSRHYRCLIMLTLHSGSTSCTPRHQSWSLRCLTACWSVTHSRTTRNSTSPFARLPSSLPINSSVSLTHRHASPISRSGGQHACPTPSP